MPPTAELVAHTKRCFFVAKKNTLISDTSVLIEKSGKHNLHDRDSEGFTSPDGSNEEHASVVQIQPEDGTSRFPPKAAFEFFSTFLELGLTTTSEEDEEDEEDLSLNVGEHIRLTETTDSFEPVQQKTMLQSLLAALTLPPTRNQKMPVVSPETPATIAADSNSDSFHKNETA